MIASMAPERDTIPVRTAIGMVAGTADTKEDT